jgi:isovaleryl-CoA dehydrogenase
VSDFTRRSIPPAVAAATDRDNAFPPAMWRALGDAGLLGITADEAVGGLGMGYQAHCVVMEELSRASGSIGLSYAAHSQLCVNQIQLNGSAAQKTKYLPGLVSGDVVGALAMSESGAGSDVMSMRTAAKRVPGGWSLTGTKMWITNGPDAGVVVVYARTDPAAGTKGLTAFIVDVAAAGDAFSCARKLDKMGMRGSNTGELVLEDVFVPDADVLGAVGGGARVLMSGLDLERLVLSAGPIGLMRAALEDVAAPFVHQRRQFGQPVAHNQLVQGKLADMYTAMRAASALTYEAARAADEGGAVSSKDCAGAILFAAEAGTRVALDAIQLLGGMGYVEEMPASRIMRE